MLVGREPSCDKRIKVNVRNVLSGKALSGSPDWIDTAVKYVGSSPGAVSNQPHKFLGFDLEFSDDNLFGPKELKSNGCNLRNFRIYTLGAEEKTDVVMDFTIQMPWSDKLWRWIGQYGGKSVYIRYTPGVAPSEEEESDIEHQGDASAGDDNT